MGVTDWTTQFNLRSTVYTANPIPGSVAPDPLPINVPITFSGGDIGVYRLRPDGCSIQNVVRETKDYVPQGDGSILHRRFVAGMEMSLAVQMWQPNDKIACDSILQKMVDTLEGYLYGLLNAGDDEGRLFWTPSGQLARMMQDIRLLSYWEESQAPGSALEVRFTIDTARPYLEDHAQLSPGIPGTVVNPGNRPAYPVWKIFAGTFTLTNVTTGQKLEFNDTQPGCPSIGGGYVEINTFRNTVYKNGSGANCKPGIVMVSSDFFPLVPGNNVITCAGAGGGSVCLVNAAWA
jgi:hypothetical protein